MRAMREERKTIETKRLRIYPAGKEQMEAFIAAEQEPELQAAYREMLEGCLRHSGQWEWYAVWMVESKDGEHLGDLCFKGLNPDGTAEIGYGILEAYRGQGYAAEAVRAALDWAFGHPEVRAVEAETEAENKPSQRVLAKCAFTASGKIGEEGPRFVLTRAVWEKR